MIVVGLPGPSDARKTSLVEGFGASPLPTILVGDRRAASLGGVVITRGEGGLESLVDRVPALEALEVTFDR